MTGALDEVYQVLQQLKASTLWLIVYKFEKYYSCNDCETFTNLLLNLLYKQNNLLFNQKYKGRGGLTVHKVSVSQPQNCGSKSQAGHDHDSSYDTSTDWFKEADLRVILNKL